MRRHFWLLTLTCAAAACTKADTTGPAVVPDAGAPRPALTAVGPRLLSNQTSQPISVSGSGLTPGLTLSVGSPVDLQLPLVVLDERHAFARLPAGLKLPAERSEVVVPVGLGGGPQGLTLRLINDDAFPDLTAMALSADGQRLAAISGPEDAVYVFEVASKKVTRLDAGDGPSAIGAWADGEGHGWFVVAHQFEPTLVLLRGDERRTLPAPAYATGLKVDQRAGVVFVAEAARDTVSALRLTDGKELWRAPVAPNPRELELTAAGLAVGSLQTGQIELLDPATGAVQANLQPGPKTVLLGPATHEMARVKQDQAHFSQFVMNGKAPRALAWSAASKRLLVASIGPNIGPNPDKMEVTMNGGVASVDLAARSWQRHLGFGAGVTDALALDDQRGLLYAADDALGLVRVLDVKKLTGSDASASKALLQEIAMPPAEGFPHARPDADFGVEGRAGLAIHSGPRALQLSPDRQSLWVLNRFTGTVARVDVKLAAQGRAVWKEQTALTDVLGQKVRRLGQVLYYADLGRTAMSCDACHLEGHNEGVLFEKTHPLRIYRSPTVRGSRETPPYFTPASTHSMGETMKVVGGRNRYHNPDLTDAETEALTLFGSCLTTLPNPFVGADGAPLEQLALPSGQTGHPRNGLLLFEGKAACVECHPAPQYTTDQDVATRGRYLEVGTPHLMPLRANLQDARFAGFAPPSLLGAWDIFPMLTTGLAGLGVENDAQVVVKNRFALQSAVLDWPGKHGRADLLTDAEKNDLLAFVMSL